MMIKIFNKDALSLMQSQEFLDLTKDKKVVIVTDPPFNIGYHYNEYKDKLSEDKYYNHLKNIFTTLKLPFVVIHYPEALYKLSHVVNKIPERVVSWVYNSNTAKQHRDIAFFDIKPNFKQVLQPYKNLNDKRIQERIARGIRGGENSMIGGILIK